MINRLDLDYFFFVFIIGIVTKHFLEVAGAARENNSVGFDTLCMLATGLELNITESLGVTQSIEIIEETRGITFGQVLDIGGGVGSFGVGELRHFVVSSLDRDARGQAIRLSSLIE